jgi:hypothetical protein
MVALDLLCVIRSNQYNISYPREENTRSVKQKGADRKKQKVMSENDKFNKKPGLSFIRYSDRLNCNI